MYRNAKNVGYYMIGPDSRTSFRSDAPRAPKPDSPGNLVLSTISLQPCAGRKAEYPRMGYARFRRYQRAHCESVDKYTEQVKHFLNGRRPAPCWPLAAAPQWIPAEVRGNLLTNPGKAADYQSWDLVKNPALQDCRAPAFRHGFRRSSPHGHNDQP